jgi:hypothetical protein
MTPDDPEHTRRTRSEARLLWVALVVLAGCLVLGVAVILNLHPTLTSDIWPDRPTGPRQVR